MNKQSEDKTLREIARQFNTLDDDAFEAALPTLARQFNSAGDAGDERGVNLIHTLGDTIGED